MECSKQIFEIKSKFLRDNHFILFKGIIYFIKNIKALIQNKINTHNNACINIKNKLENRTKPFDFENEFL